MILDVPTGGESVSRPMEDSFDHPRTSEGIGTCCGGCTFGRSIGPHFSNLQTNYMLGWPAKYTLLVSFLYVDGLAASFTPKSTALITRCDKIG
jgi:hypothetical protein